MDLKTKHDMRFFFAGRIAFYLMLPVLTAFAAVAQQSVPLPPTQFNIGERISYEIGFEKFDNVAYAETEVVSRGRFADRDAVELHGKFRTQNFIAERFTFVDEDRTTFVAADTGVPIYSTVSSNISGLPEVTTYDNRNTGSTALDILSLIYRIRQSAGTGTATINENGRTYAVSFSTSGTAKISSALGDFETTVVSVTGDYFTERGFTAVTINLTMDQDRVPVAFSARLGKKEEFRGVVASLSNTTPDTAEPAPVPTPTPTPVPNPTPRPVPTPEVYVNDQPLSTDLAFKLGERLEYRITKSGVPIGLMTLDAKERRQVFNKDSLLLTATITGIDQANQIFKLNDSVRAQVDPYSLTPHSIELKFGGALSNYNAIALFNAAANSITVNANQRIDSPAGTHSVLSLLYAMRSFNLKRSPDPQSPVNDTRVAVFWDGAVNVFTLRPANGEELTINGKKIGAQMISITAADPKISGLNPKVWLTNETPRVPVRITIGEYQFDLNSQKNLLGK